MKKYELLLILPGTLDDKQAETRANEIVAMVKEHGSEVELTTIGKNRLAYPIKQIRYGYFYTVVFTAESAALKKLEHKLSLLRDVLRTMVTNFNIALTPAQKIAYTTEGMGMTPVMAENKDMPVMPMKEKEMASAPTPAMKKAMPAVEEMDVVPAEMKGPAPTPRSAAVKPDAASMEEITKKLDEILSGDNIIPGV